MKLYHVLAHALLLQLYAAIMTVSAAAAAAVEEEERSPLITNGIENVGNRGYEESLSLKKKKRALLVDEYVSSVRDWVPRKDDSVLPIGLTASEEAEVLQQQTATKGYGLTTTRSNNNSSKKNEKTEKTSISARVESNAGCVDRIFNVGVLSKFRTFPRTHQGYVQTS